MGLNHVAQIVNMSDPEAQPVMAEIPSANGIRFNMSRVIRIDRVGLASTGEPWDPTSGGLTIGSRLILDGVGLETLLSEPESEVFVDATVPCAIGSLPVNHKAVSWIVVGRAVAWPLTFPGQAVVYHLGERWTAWPNASSLTPLTFSSVKSGPPTIEPM